jgi:hypothetical protein
VSNHGYDLEVLTDVLIVPTGEVEACEGIMKRPTEFGSLVNSFAPIPPLFPELRILKDFKSFVFGTAHSKGVMGAFFGTAHSKGVSVIKGADEGLGRGSRLVNSTGK